MVVLDKDLVLYLPFSEGSGSKVYDRSKHDNHGTVNGPVFIRPYEDDEEDEGYSPLVVYDDDETTIGIDQGGSGTYQLAISEETSEVKKGSSSLKGVVSSGSYSYIAAYYSFTPTVDVSKYDFISIWLYGGNSGKTWEVTLYNVGGIERRKWQFTDDFSGWERKILLIERYTSQTASFDITAVKYFYVFFPTAVGTYYFDKIVFDVGNWKHGEALDFDGVDDWVDLPNNFLDEFGQTPIPFTILAWVKSRTVGNHCILNLNGNEFYWRTNTIGFYSAAGGYGGNTVLSTDTWYLFTWVFDGTDLLFYVNARYDGKVSSIQFDSFGGTTNYIGRWSAGAEVFDGPIDEIRIYKRVLTPEEIRSLYEEKSFDLNRGLVLHLPFSEGNGTKVYDRSPYQNHGNVTGAVFLKPYENDDEDEGDNPIVVYDDDETFWTAHQTGAGSYGITISEETSTVKKGSSSLKVVVGSGSYEKVGVNHAYGSPQDWSKYDFVSFWWYGINSGEGWTFQIDSSGAWRKYYFTDNFTGWKRIIISLERPDVETGTLDLSAVTNVRIWNETPSSNGTIYLDRVILDVGNWKHGEALDFDGSSDYVNIPSSNSMHYYHGDPISVFTWMKPDTTSTMDIFAVASGATIRMFLVSATEFAVQFNGFGNSATFTFSAGQWYHVGFTFDGTTLKIYINGKLFYSASPNGGTPNTWTGDWTVGKSQYTYFDGAIDEVRVYNRVLSPEEIRALYEEKKQRSE